MNKDIACIGCGRCDECVPKPITYLPHRRCQICLSRSPIFSLPLEILLELSSYLDVASVWRVRLTCRALYLNLPAAAGPLREQETHAFYTSLRHLIPRRLIYCPQCIRYHSWERSDYYTAQTPGGWKLLYFCLRHFDRNGYLPPLLTSHDYYICRQCLVAQSGKSCRICRRCEDCARLGTKCDRCAISIIQCTSCNRKLNSSVVCETCSRCETCAGIQFQTVDRRCNSCKRNARAIRKTGSALVTTLNNFRVEGMGRMYNNRLAGNR